MALPPIRFAANLSNFLAQLGRIWSSLSRKEVLKKPNGLPDPGLEMEPRNKQEDSRVSRQNPLLHPFLRALDEESAKAELECPLRPKRLAPVPHFVLLERASSEQLPSPSTPLPEIAAWALQQAAGPLPWNDFVTAVAFILQVKDERISLDRKNLETLLRAQQPRSQTGGESLNRDRLRNLWEQLQGLDRKERPVLLLKAEDLLDFELTQVATLQDLSASLGIPFSHILSLLPTLPLDDHQIARLLGIQRQTVVNLRSQARLTLRRRLQTQRTPNE